MRKHHAILWIVFVASLLPLSSVALAAAIDVAPGYDLFATQPGTNFNFGGGPVPLVGVPLGTYNFGGSIGVQNVGNTDTIVQRLSDAVAPSIPGTAPTISTQMLTLDLETAAPINLGSGLHFYFITLQSARTEPLPKPVTMGTMDISFGSSSGGTFNSFFDVFFDIRQDSLNGPIVNSTDLTLSQNGDTWGRMPPPGAETINGVNINLNGTNNASDFWPGVPFTESHPSAGTHIVSDATVPEPTAALVLLAAGSAALFRRRR